MGKPAAVIGSMHICPKVTSKVPHVGGPVVDGSPNVTIGGLPAARRGDKLICVGPPDTIKSGSGSVFINGKPAARMGDSTNHGGTITIGNGSVTIGDRYRPPKKSPPKTFEEAKQRLKEAKPYVDAARKNGATLPGTPYTTADKKQIVGKGLEEPLLFRVTETRFTNDSDYIGYKPPEIQTAKYWTTTFTQAEHGDSDPEAICHAVGVNFDPEAEYSILLIDHQKAEALGDMKSFIPTYGAMSELTASELSNEFGESEELVELCLTPEFSQYYEKVIHSSNTEGVDISKPKEFSEYCQELEFTPTQAKTLAVRHQIAQRLGANEHFLGNGLTKDTSVDNQTTPFGEINEECDYGLCEVFTWDKNPHTLGTLQKAGAIDRVKLGKGRKK